MVGGRLEDRGSGRPLLADDLPWDCRQRIIKAKRPVTKRLVVRLVRTTNVDLPVRLRIAANGNARLGAGNDVRRREASIVIGAQLVRGPGGAYRFEEQGS